MVVVAWLPKPVPVESAIVEQGPLIVSVDEDGRTRVKDRYVVSAPLTGSIARIELEPGRSVGQGQVLARIMPLAAPLLDARARSAAEARLAATAAARRQTRAHVDRARASLEFSKKEAAQVRALAQSGSLAQAALDRALLDERASAADLASAEFAARVADHEQEMARATLGRFDRARSDVEEQFEIPSPVAGRVLRVIQESEGVVQLGTPLVEVGDPSALEVVVDVLTSDAVNIPRGAPVSIEQWGGAPLKGHVRLIEPSAFTRLSALGVEEQRVNAIVDLDEPYARWSALGDGYRVEARIVTWRGDAVLKVPSSALFRHDGKWAVFLIRDGIANVRTVQVGRRSGMEAQVEKGLERGDRIVVHPSDRVADGVPVEAR
jgi:HlyD family secretion protein